MKRRTATYADLCAVPEHLVAEIVDGELYTTPRPATPHVRASTVLMADLVGGFDGPPGGSASPGGWWFLVEPELHLGSNVLVPDIAGWRRDRCARIPDVVGITIVPDWVCEVLSPSTVRLDRVRKMRIYARAGIGHAWLVDAVARTLETYRLRDGQWTLVETHVGNGPVHAEPFDVLALTMGRWWLET